MSYQKSYGDSKPSAEILLRDGYNVVPGINFKEDLRDILTSPKLQEGLSAFCKTHNIPTLIVGLESEKADRFYLSLESEPLELDRDTARCFDKLFIGAFSGRKIDFQTSENQFYVKNLWTSLSLRMEMKHGGYNGTEYFYDGDSSALYFDFPTLRWLTYSEHQELTQARHLSFNSETKF